MKIVRTFHPVGQGAFYTEKLYDASFKIQHIMVFDCGVAWGHIAKAKRIVQQAFDDNDVIDYLFISHLDYDHISLVETLIEKVSHIRRIVLPLISDEDLVISMAFYRIAKKVSGVEFCRRVISYLKGYSNGDYQNGENSLLFVCGEESESPYPGVRRWINGQARNMAVPDSPDWVFIPYNVESTSRRATMLQKLGELLKDSSVNKELNSIGLSVTTSEEFFEALKDPTFVETVIKNNGPILKGLKDIYDKIGGTINDNSLQLYSGPCSGDHQMYERYVRPRFFWGQTHRVACLYTGDCQCDINDWRTKSYSKVWGNVGTIQIPHHGSIESFDFTKNQIDRRYMFVVSCGNNNTYGHPSGKVLEYLALNDSCYQIVSESKDSIYMRVIWEK